MFLSHADSCLVMPSQVGSFQEMLSHVGSCWILGAKGTREHYFTKRQGIWTGPVKEKTN